MRGVVGQSLTPKLLTRFAEAFGTHTGSGTIVIGRDPRTSGEMVKHAVVAGLLSTGSRVVDIGVCPVPTVQLQVRHRRAQGGIAITASHNPAEWNAADPMPAPIANRLSIAKFGASAAVAIIKVVPATAHNAR